MNQNVVMWAAIVAFLMPVVQAGIVQFHWPAPLASLLNFLSCAVGAAGTVYFEGDLKARTFVETMLIVFTGTIAAYHGLWKPTNIAPAIENATTPAPKPQAPVVAA